MTMNVSFEQELERTTIGLTTQPIERGVDDVERIVHKGARHDTVQEL